MFHISKVLRSGLDLRPGTASIPSSSGGIDPHFIHKGDYLPSRGTIVPICSYGTTSDLTSSESAYDRGLPRLRGGFDSCRSATQSSEYPEFSTFSTIKKGSGRKKKSPKQEKEMKACPGFPKGT